MKRIVTLAVCLFLSSTVWATCYGVNPQMCVNYVGTPNATLADNTAYATTHNAWHALTSTPAISKIASGFYGGDFATWGVDSAGNAWEYHDAIQGGDGTWSQHSEMGTDNLAFSIGGGVFFRMRKSTTGCANGGHQVDTWSGTVWIAKGGFCAQSISASAQDGTLYGIAVVSGVQKAYFYNGSGWAQLTGGPYQSIAGFNSGEVYANDTAGGIWYRQNANSTSMIKLTGVTDQGSGPLYFDVNHTLWKLFGNQVLRLNDASGWDRFVSNTFTSIAAASPWHVFGVTSTGIYRLNTQSLTVSISLTGNSTCTPAPCPGNPLHTPKVDVHLANSMTGGQTVTGQAVPPTTNVNISASDTTWDAVGCLEFGEQGACVEIGGGAFVTCSMMGQIFSFVGGGGLFPTKGGLYHVTHEKIDNNGTNCTTIRGDRWCSYSVVPACPNPPPYAFTNIQERGIDKLVALLWGWIVYESCLTFPNGGYLCLPVGGGVGVGSDPGFRCDTPADVLAP